MTTATVDYEYHADEFWDEFRRRVDALRQDSELAKNCHALLQDDRVSLTPDARAKLEAFVLAIPGYNGGPDHARTAIVFTD